MALIMKKVLTFVGQNIVGVLAGALLAFVVWKFTGFNIWLLLVGFIGGYYVVGIPVELLVLYLEDGAVRKIPPKKKVRPDDEAGYDLASSDDLDFITEKDDLYSPSDGEKKDS